jgi:hypothetical protein
MQTDGGNHDVPAVEQLVELVPGFLPELREASHRSPHGGETTANARFDGIGRIDELDVRSREFQELLRISIDQPVLVDVADQLDVLLRHRPRSILARAAALHGGCRANAGEWLGWRFRGTANELD